MYLCQLKKMEQLKELLLQNNSSTLLGLGGIMKLKEIFNIIDKTKNKLLKEITYEDKDFNIVTEMILEIFAMQIKISLKEADKNEH